MDKINSYDEIYNSMIEVCKSLNIYCEKHQCCFKQDRKDPKSDPYCPKCKESQEK